MEPLSNPFLNVSRPFDKPSSKLSPEVLSHYYPADIGHSSKSTSNCPLKYIITQKHVILKQTKTLKTHQLCPGPQELASYYFNELLTLYQTRCVFKSRPFFRN